MDHPEPKPESKLEPEPQKAHQAKPGHDDWHEIVYVLAAAIAVAAILTLFVFRSYRVDGVSMETTLQNNDRLVIDELPRTLARVTHHAYIPHRGDIIVFNQSQAGGFDSPNLGTKQLIKRVIGLPGDRVVIKNGQVTVYNTTSPSGFDPDTSGLYHLDDTTTTADSTIDVTLGADQLYVLGDNRANSTDSRVFGPINANQIVGKLSLRIFPLSDAQRF